MKDLWSAEGSSPINYRLLRQACFDTDGQTHYYGLRVVGRYRLWSIGWPILLIRHFRRGQAIWAGSGALWNRDAFRRTADHWSGGAEHVCPSFFSEEVPGGRLRAAGRARRAEEPPWTVVRYRHVCAKICQDAPRTHTRCLIARPAR